MENGPKVWLGNPTAQRPGTARPSRGTTRPLQRRPSYLRPSIDRRSRRYTRGETQDQYRQPSLQPRYRPPQALPRPPWPSRRPLWLPLASPLRWPRQLPPNHDCHQRCWVLQILRRCSTRSSNFTPARTIPTRNNPLTTSGSGQQNPVAPNLGNMESPDIPSTADAVSTAFCTDLLHSAPRTGTTQERSPINPTQS